MSHAAFLPRGISDHSPGFVTIVGIERERVFKPFQLFSHMLLEPNFIDEVKKCLEYCCYWEPLVRFVD